MADTPIKNLTTSPPQATDIIPIGRVGGSTALGITPAGLDSYIGALKPANIGTTVQAQLTGAVNIAVGTVNGTNATFTGTGSDTLVSGPYMFLFDGGASGALAQLGASGSMDFWTSNGGSWGIRQRINPNGDTDFSTNIRVGPVAGVHTTLSNNQLAALNNAAVSTLYLQFTGGATVINGSGAGSSPVLVGNTTSITGAQLEVTGNISASTTIRTGGYTVGTLPAGSIGDRAYVTDALGPVFGSAVVGGGAVVIPVFRNASTWIVG